MLRPRSDEESDPNKGGGVLYRQGPHQLDTVRLLGGGMLQSVRGPTGDWGVRDIAGYFSAYLEFEDGTPVTVVHNGYGYFIAGELTPWDSGRTRYTAEQRAENRKKLRAGTWDQNEGKDNMRIGGRDEVSTFRRGGERRPWQPGDLGMVVASCERGDMRHSEYGVYVYDDEGRRDIPVPRQSAMRRAELDEIYNAIALGEPVYHDGRWGMATLEACLAIIESGQKRAQITLTHQVPVHPGYDKMLAAQQV